MSREMGETNYTEIFIISCVVGCIMGISTSSILFGMIVGILFFLMASAVSDL